MNIGKTNAEASIVIFTHSSSFQEGLKALLDATHSSFDFWIVDSENAGKWFHKSSHPKLVMIDSAAFKDSGVALLHQLKARFNNVKFLVFVETVHDNQIFENIGIDGLLFKGFTNQELENKITMLLNDSMEPNYE